ncbi:nicotinamide mononucleotide adenylyltransferase [Pelomyxa schiedti]|nr:nicotinamide mononucleotide adenylyltransferase [Pelomyxa schiedti]
MAHPSEETTPTRDLAALIVRHHEAHPTKQLVVLLATGSFNPVHHMHIRQFEIARHWLNSHENLHVVAGYISPSHDGYLRDKLGDQAIAWTERVRMCELAVEDHFTQFPAEDGFTIFVDKWEGMQSRFIDFPDVARDRRDFFASRFAAFNLITLFLCGTDLYVKWLTSSEYVVSVPRPGYTVSRKSTALHNYTVPPGEGGPFERDSDVSSTAMRNARDEEFLSSVTYSSVVRHLKTIGWSH